jgi:hypothetical protein
LPTTLHPWDTAGRVSTANSARLELASWVLVVGVLAAAVALRFVGLDRLPGINGDEAVFPVHATEWMTGAPWSDLRGGTHRPMSPVYFAPVVFIRALLPATFWTLRLAAVVQSLLTIALAFVLFRRRGVAFAAIFATLLAVIPIQLGYARLAWDPTAVPTVMVLALAAATRASLVLTILASVLCFTAHPTTAFAAPILVAPLVVAKWPRDQDGNFKRLGRRALVLTAACGVGTISALYVAVAAGFLPTSVHSALRAALSAQTLERLIHPFEALRFALLYAEFVSGPTIYRYIPGSMPSVPAWLHVAVAVTLLAVLVVPALRRLRGTDRAVALGLLLSLIGAYVLGGLQVLEPSTERYGMFLIVPTCYLLAASIDALGVTARRAALARVATAGMGVALMASFVAYFLVPLHRAIPARHETYRTGDIEPKQAAFAEILARRDQSRATVIRVEDWWLYWPLRYLAGDHADVHVTIEGVRRRSLPYPRDFVPPRLDPATVEAFGVAWVGSRQDTKFAGNSLENFDIAGYEHGPILRVHVLRTPAPR